MVPRPPHPHQHRTRIAELKAPDVSSTRTSPEPGSPESVMEEIPGIEPVGIFHLLRIYLIVYL